MRVPRAVLMLVAPAILLGAFGAKPVPGEARKETPVTHRTDWFRDARWGVFTHYLTSKDTTAEDWNRRVNGFDVAALARQLASVGTRYYVITLGQNSGHYCTPNATYDRFVGTRPSLCAARDLIADLYDALHPKGIRLMVYLPAGAPNQDAAAMKALQWQNGAHRNLEFQRKWEAVIREWSLRWGPKVTGWWFDGCYWPDAMYRFSEPPNFASFAQAARAGNPDAIVAFNPGVLNPIITMTESEDYTAGEINDPGAVECDGRWVGKAQFHMLSFLGPEWGRGPPRFTTAQIVRWTGDLIESGGVVTWDVPIEAGGAIPRPFIDQLQALRDGLAKPRAARPDLPAVPPGNLASHKPARLLDVTGTKRLQVNSGTHHAALGVDGDPQTWAQAGGEWPWTYHVDLKAAHPVSRVVVTFAKDCYATQYNVNLSADGARWTTAAHATGARGRRHEHAFAKTDARYVRIQALQPDGPNQPGAQMGVAELEVY